MDPAGWILGATDLSFGLHARNTVFISVARLTGVSREGSSTASARDGRGEQNVRWSLVHPRGYLEGVHGNYCLPSR